MQYVLKVILTAILVVAISETGKRSTPLAAVLASLPLTSILAFVWLYSETGDAARTGALAGSIFWYVLPSLVLFLVMPAMINRGFGFWPSLAAGCGLTFLAYLGMAAALQRFGVTI